MEIFFYYKHIYYIITTSKLHRDPHKKTILQYSPGFGEEEGSHVHGVGGADAVGGGSQGRQRRLHPGGLTAQSVDYR